MGSGCTACGGTGFEIRTRPDGVTSAVRCACAEADRGERLLRLARIPRRYDHCTLDAFDLVDPRLRKALERVRDWVERWPLVEVGLLLVGAPGSGKTHLAVGLVRELVLQKGAHVLFSTERELLKALQSTYDKDAPQSESDVLAPVLETDVLVLDDVGACRPTAWGRDVLHDVISHRYNEKLPLVLTTNLDVGTEAADGLSLRDRLGDPLMSRLHEMCLFVDVQADDFRQRFRHARHHF